MIVYVILIAPIFLLAFLNMSKEFNNNVITKVVFSFFLIFLSLFAGLRKDTGFDYYSYERIFFSSEYRNLFGGSVEPGYILLNRLILKLFGSYHVLLTILAFISTLLIMRFIYRYSPYKILSLYFYVAVYFVGGITGQMRQAFAMSILTLAFRYVEERRFWPFISIVFLASLFHVSSLVFLIFYFIYPVRITKKRIISFILISIVLGSIDLMRFLIPIIELLPKYSLITSFLGYIDSRHVKSLMFSAGFFERLLAIFLVLIYFDNLINKYRNSKLLIWSYILGSSIYFFFIEYQIFARRLSSYFKIVDIILLTMIIGTVKNKYLKLVVFVIFSMLYLANLFATVNNPSGNYFPYLFIFSTN